VSIDPRQNDHLSDELAEKIVDQLRTTDSALVSAKGHVPTFDSIGHLICSLRQVIFPNFAHANMDDPQAWARELSQQLLEVQRSLESHLLQSLKLQRQIALHCDKSWDGANFSDQQLEIWASQAAKEYLSQLPAIRAALTKDVRAAYDGDPACHSPDEVILCYPGFSAVAVYRLAHQLFRLNIPLLPRMMSEWVHSQTGIDIHPGAAIDDYFFIDHGTGVVIGATCVIGKHVKIYQGVTLGALSFPQDEMGNLVRNVKRHPTIEDNVIIYANATVLGGSTIVGHDSVIGSSVWLNSSIAPFTTVVMEKPNLRMRSQTPSEFELPLNYQI
jgi:serine O-acetyltransferase